MQYTKNEILQSVQSGSIVKDFPICNGNEMLKVALDKMNLKGLGFCIIYTDIIGILTDGDIRRQITKGNMPLLALMARPLRVLGTFPCSSLSLPFNIKKFVELTNNGKTYIPIIDEKEKCRYVIDAKKFAISLPKII